MSDEQIVEALAVQLWGMNLDRDAHSIARDLLPTVRALQPAPSSECPAGCWLVQLRHWFPVQS